jgi:hypothetical protein
MIENGVKIGLSDLAYVIYKKLADDQILVLTQTNKVSAEGPNYITCENFMMAYADLDQYMEIEPPIHKGWKKMQKYDESDDDDDEGYEVSLKIAKSTSMAKKISPDNQISFVRTWHKEIDECDCPHDIDGSATTDTTCLIISKNKESLDVIRKQMEKKGGKKKKKAVNNI